MNWPRLFAVKGAALPAVLIVLASLTAATGMVLAVVKGRYNTVHQSSVWQEALVASESGVHQALAQLEHSLKNNALPTGKQTFALNLSHAGESSDSATADYTLSRVDVIRHGFKIPHYSIVSRGTVRLPGAHSLSHDSRDVILRKLRLGGAERQAVRTIEAWAVPVTSTDFAMVVDKDLILKNHKITIDSFNSEDPSRSLTGGKPPATVGQFNVAPHNMMNAHIATNSDFIAAGNAYVYGDALTNGGKVGASGNIQGEIRDDHYSALAPVYPPAWASSVVPGIPVSGELVTDLKTAALARGGTQSNPARYVLDDISLSGGNDVLTFDLGLSPLTGKVDPAKGFVELYVRGDFDAKGGGNNNASVIIENGVQVKIWVGGSMKLSGNGVTNESGRATSLSIFGVNAPVAPTNQSFELHGGAGFYGSVYAPSADLILAGGGKDGTFVGSLVGKTATLKGNANIRYDEALAGLGVISRFRLATWFEDTKVEGNFNATLN